MDEKKVKDEGAPSDSKKYPASYYKSKRLFVALIIIASVVVTLTAVFVYDYFYQNGLYSLTYTCIGVDSEWLNDHPFDTSSFPAKLKRKDPLVLHAPAIEDYKFVEWKIEWSGDSLYLSSSSTFKDGEAYKATGGLFSNIFSDKALVTAKYTKI